MGHRCAPWLTSHICHKHYRGWVFTGFWLVSKVDKDSTFFVHKEPLLGLIREYRTVHSHTEAHLLEGTIGPATASKSRKSRQSMDKTVSGAPVRTCHYLWIFCDALLILTDSPAGLQSFLYSRKRTTVLQNLFLCSPKFYVWMVLSICFPAAQWGQWELQQISPVPMHTLANSQVKRHQIIGAQKSPFPSGIYILQFSSHHLVRSFIQLSYGGMFSPPLRYALSTIILWRWTIPFNGDMYWPQLLMIYRKIFFLTSWQKSPLSPRDSLSCVEWTNSLKCFRIFMSLLSQPAFWATQLSYLIV